MNINKSFTNTFTKSNSFTNTYTHTNTYTITSTNTNTHTNLPLIEMQLCKGFAVRWLGFFGQRTGFYKCKTALS